MLYITRKESFCAAHRLFVQGWDENKNEEAFGNCSNPNWHGHNYDLYVTVKGKVNPDTGFVVNLKTLSKIVKEHIVASLDHRNLNMDVPFLQGKVTSTENVAVEIWKQLEPHVKALGIELHCIKLHESDRNIIEYYGENG